ncbi:MULTISPECIES: hypothetical protein [unclassified Janthinobacterium]|uniref:DUF6916 family protein n=1 Tax=unclassified Janthinobacterium TaxID=2610881 RepID=UPI000880A86C|nr:MULTISPECIES: hypothetical protein [unclassified Janthinobacterium]SDA41615.1 hypothetical protein SAMN03159349_00513 [Janthinobacterium sp. 551a]SFA86539.1 hypothetical protein SAMN03159300_101513 [Janthinobacterium sp. 344]
MNIAPMITLEQLLPCLQTEFLAHCSGGLLALRLDEALELPRRGLPETFRTPLSLIFSGPAQLLLEEGQYVLEHPLLGRQQWYLWPIAPAFPARAQDEGRQRYQVSFS